MKSRALPHSASRRRRFVQQPVDALRLRKSGDRKLAKIGPSAGADASESGRCHDRAIEAAGEVFQPRRKIDGWTDAGEIQPVAAADITVQDFSNMQSDPEAEALDGFSNREMHRFHAGAGFARRLQHTRADLPDIADILI